MRIARAAAWLPASTMSCRRDRLDAARAISARAKKPQIKISKTNIARAFIA